MLLVDKHTTTERLGRFGSYFLNVHNSPNKVFTEKSFGKAAWEIGKFGKN